MLQSIILNQHISHSTMALMQTQMDNGFAAMKHFMQWQNAALDSNIRCFGGAIQGGFAWQDPRQAGDWRKALAKLAQNNLQPGKCDGTPELTPSLQTLEDLWKEWKFGLGRCKTPQQFAPTEHGQHGHCSKKKGWWMKPDRQQRQNMRFERPMVIHFPSRLSAKQSRACLCIRTFDIPTLVEFKGESPPLHLEGMVVVGGGEPSG